MVNIRLMANTNVDFLTKGRSFYKLNSECLTKNFDLWCEKFPKIHPYYAVKCNNNDYLIEKLASMGCSFDCASLSEINQVNRILDKIDRKIKYSCESHGIINNNPIIYANPIKQPNELSKISELGVCLMTADSVEELEKIAECSSNVKIIIRIAVDDSHSICQFNKKFGLMPMNDDGSAHEELIKFMEKYKCLKREIDTSKQCFDLVGVSFHVGSSCQSAKSYGDAIKKCGFVFNLAKEYGVNLEIVDIGGGFIQKEPLLSEVSEVIRKSLDEYFGKNNDLCLIAEPGRFMVANVLDLYVSVIGKKKNNSNIRYYLSDSIYGSFNCKIYDYAKLEFEIYMEKNLCPYSLIMGNYYPHVKNNENKWIKNGKETECDEHCQVIFFGATCDSVDLIIEENNLLLPDLSIGDYLCFHNMGAYTLSSSCEFNGVPLPIIYINSELI